MSWRPHGRARVNPKSPQAFAICDRCGFLYNHVDLMFQYDWRGNMITNTNTLVCQKCCDIPYEGRRPIRLTADPLPIRNPRPMNKAYSVDNDVPPAQWDEAGLLYDDGQTSWQT